MDEPAASAAGRGATPQTGLAADRQAIHTALADCARLADENRPAELVALFTPDCQVRFGRANRLGNRAELLAYLRSALRRYPATSHLLGIPAITPTGPYSADVVTTVRAWHRRADGGETVLHGRYVDRFVRTGDTWLIASRELQVAGAQGHDGALIPIPRADSGEPAAADDGQVIVAGWIDWAAEHRDLALACFREVTGPSLAEPGCLDYTMTADAVDPQRIHVFERWRRAADLTEHLASGHIADFRARTASLTRLGRGLNRYRVDAAEPMGSSR